MPPGCRHPAERVAARRSCRRRSHEARGRACARGGSGGRRSACEASRAGCRLESRSRACYGMVEVRGTCAGRERALLRHLAQCAHDHPGRVHGRAELGWGHGCEGGRWMAGRQDDEEDGELEDSKRPGTRTYNTSGIRAPFALKCLRSAWPTLAAHDAGGVDWIARPHGPRQD